MTMEWTAQGRAARRTLILAGTGALLASRAAIAGLFDTLSAPEATEGIRAALERGAGAAVDLLGKTDGYWGNERVRIPLPDWLAKAEGAFRLFGRKRDLDELHEAINRAAEEAVPEARELLIGAVHEMSVRDARAILAGGDNSATQYFERETRAPLGDRFLPVVTRVTRANGLAQRYDGVARKAQTLGLTRSDETIEHHVTSRALDGLFLMIGDEERRIRADPARTGSAILAKVFGSP